MLSATCDFTEVAILFLKIVVLFSGSIYLQASDPV